MWYEFVDVIYCLLKALLFSTAYTATGELNYPDQALRTCGAQRGDSSGRERDHPSTIVSASSVSEDTPFSTEFSRTSSVPVNPVTGMVVLVPVKPVTVV